VGSYAEQPGSTTCTPCGGQKVTSSKGSTSRTACFCPDAQFESSTGTCRPCGTCLPNEYVASPCGGTSDAQCRACDACAASGTYVSNLCKGFSSTKEQTCSPCKTSRQCSQTDPNFLTLSRCYAGGEISVDTTVCLPSAGGYKVVPSL
jgi:hypothetical protein